MKNLKALLVVAVVAVAMVGCTKLEKVLPKGDGVWKTTSEVTVEYVNNVVDTTYSTPASELSTYTFNSDGTGSVAYDGQTDNFTWSANSDGDQITLVPEGTSLAVAIEVLESSAKAQKWFYSFDYGNGDRDETTIDLERQ
jgi:hypothetical protein